MKRYSCSLLTITTLTLTILAGLPMHATDLDPENPAAKQKRLEWFRHDKYRLFIH